MDLIATKRCFYRTWREPGERFTADRARGRALLQMKLARRAPVTAPATYSHRAITQTRRVDMQAEKPVVAPEPDSATIISAFDHDGDGAPGGSTAPEPADELTTARADYRLATGKRFFPGWSVEQLREKIAAASEPDED